MPLLEGKAADDARAALSDLSARYLRLRPSTLQISLMAGLPGVALAHMALDRVFPEAGHGARAERSLLYALQRASSETLTPSLYGGIAGVGWVTAHVVEGLPDDGDHPCHAVDEALDGVLDQPSWSAPYDVVYGLVGIGVYALERMPRPSSRRLLARIVEHLSTTAHRHAEGVAWRSDPEWIPEQWRSGPNPDWNLGLAHGVPGVIALLARVVMADVDEATRTNARRLLEQAVAWVLAQQLPATAHGCFASAVGPGIPRAPARLGWCNGDLGIAASLLLAARAVGNPTWETTAVRVALRATSRPLALSGVEDAGLCHGAAGLGHLFHRLYRTTGEERFASASREWFARTLAARVPGRGFAGYRAHGPDAKGKLRWQSDPGFLVGAGGITLALVAAVTDEEPAWDRLLLLS